MKSNENKFNNVEKEKNLFLSSFNNRSTRISILLVLFILIVLILIIPILYSRGRNQNQSLNLNIQNVSSAYRDNECSQQLTSYALYYSLNNVEPFPYQFIEILYRPPVISNEISVYFGFQHNNGSWAIDLISLIDVMTNDQIFIDGSFESNYLGKSYSQCILSNTQSSTGQILFDLPFDQDFYYNDQTVAGMTYLIQSAIPVVGGRYYQLTFYLENRGYPTNTFVVIVGS